MSAVFWVTKMASTATKSKPAWKTTVSAARIKLWVWWWFSWETSWRRETVLAGARWVSAFTWTTRASPPCGSSRSVPTTTWQRSLWGSSRKLDLPRRGDEDTEGKARTLPHSICFSCCWILRDALPSSLALTYIFITILAIFTNIFYSFPHFLFQLNLFLTPFFCLSATVCLSDLARGLNTSLHFPGVPVQ